MSLGPQLCAIPSSSIVCLLFWKDSLTHSAHYLFPLPHLFVFLRKDFLLLRYPVRNTGCLCLDPNHNETTGSSLCGHWIILNSQIIFLGHIDTQQKHHHLVLIYNLRIFNHHSWAVQKEYVAFDLDWIAWWTSNHSHPLSLLSISTAVLRFPLVFNLPSGFSSL